MSKPKEQVDLVVTFADGREELRTGVPWSRLLYAGRWFHPPGPGARLRYDGTEWVVSVAGADAVRLTEPLELREQLSQ